MSKEKPKLKAVPSADEIRTSKITKEFEVPLTVLEYAAKAKDMAALDSEIIKLEGEQKASNAEFNAKIKERETKRREYSAAVSNGKELRTLQATMVKNFAENLVQFWVEGTGKNADVRTLLEERSMTAQERQLTLDDAKPKQTQAQKRAADLKKDRKKPEQLSEIDAHIKAETSKKTKRSTVDGVYTS